MIVLSLPPAGASRATYRAAALALLLATGSALPVRALDALPSWREGPTKRAILAWVERVSRPGSADGAAGDGTAEPSPGWNVDSALASSGC